MLKEQFREELFAFQNEIELDSSIHELFYEYRFLPVKYIRKIDSKLFDRYLLVFSLQPTPAMFMDVHFYSKLLHEMHPLKTPERNWMTLGSKSSDYAQMWNRTVYDFLKDSISNKYEKEILLLEAFFDEYFINPYDYESFILTSKNSIKTNSVGGRPKGLTKRTLDRYKKVYHQYEILKKKNTSKKKSELYELLASTDYDSKTFSRRFIRNIIEDKKYNLIPSR